MTTTATEAARKSGYRPKKMTHQAIYLGPLAQVVDDFGNTFPRGQHDWQVISKSSVAGQFLLSEAAAPAMEGCCS